MLKLGSRKEQDITCLDLDGEFGIDAYRPLESFLNKDSSNSSPGIIWNFKDVSSISGGGIGILLNAYLDMKDRGIIPRLANLRPDVLDVLQVHKVLSAFEIYSDEAAASKNIRNEMETRGEGYRRLFDRISIDLKARFKRFRKGRQAAVHSTYDCTAKSLSRCGIFLQSKITYPANTLLEVDLLLPEGIIKSRVKFLGKVVWVADSETQKDLYPGMALSIMNIDESERARLVGYLDEYGV